MRPEILFPLFAPVTSLKGVGGRVAPLLERLAGPVVRDLLFLAPQGVVRRTRSKAATAPDGEIVTVEVTIESHARPQRANHPWRIRVFDDTGFLELLWFKGHGPHLELSHPVGARRVVSGKVERERGRFDGGPQIIHPDYFVSVERASLIPEIEPIYPLTAGLTSRTVRRFVLEAVERAPLLVEWQDSAWITRQKWPRWRDAVFQLHAPSAEADIGLDTPSRRRLAFDELLAHQLALGRRKRGRRAQPAPAIAESALAQRVLDALPFALTKAQQRVLGEVRADLATGHKMTRLIQGDVGAGKTVIAMLAMAEAAASGRQSALMAPTEILARQHFETVRGPLAAEGVTTTLLSGRDKGAARTAKLAALAAGEVKVAIGTHALFQDDVAFADLALTVIDEQHRFGVSERARLQAKGPTAHMLAMSATPIPRTLELTLFGDLDVSRLDEKPPGRRVVATRAAPTPRIEEVVSRLDRAVAAGAQAYWICPLVSETESTDLAAAESRAHALRQRFGAAVGLIHGGLPAADKDQAMTDFAEGRLKILVATTVVEVGMDVPEATIMVIEQAERFGLAQLHQLRGRVGRGGKESSCVLLYEPPLSQVAGRRLDILRRTDDGFAIAELDLELRGGGDPLGLKQSGFPAYRLADPVAHRDLIAPAADHARLILARESNATGASENAAAVLTSLFDWRGEDGTDAG